eukprot:TRINITY_DN46298_c0_g1_i1.p1 TRINITY_DN46298_c0_g1~~TRINITY_DN46298_c0_g1_i1.p1  ORF type:complete len:591 (+),score=136.45 TRINITY_DN46298_c0_g1_i1:59-1774(+)
MHKEKHHTSPPKSDITEWATELRTENSLLLEQLRGLREELQRTDTALADEKLVTGSLRQQVQAQQQQLSQQQAQQNNHTTQPAPPSAQDRFLEELDFAEKDHKVKQLETELQNRISAFAAEKQMLLQEINQLSQDSQKHLTRVDQLQQHLEQQQTLLQQGDLQKQQTQDRITELEGELKQKSKKKNDEKEAVIKERDDIKKEKNSLQKKLNEAEHAKEKLDKKFRKLQEEHDALKQQKKEIANTLSKDVDEAHLSVKTTTSKMGLISDDNKRLQEKLIAQQTDLDNAFEQINQLTKTVKEKEEEIMVHECEIEALNKSVEALSTELHETEDREHDARTAKATTEANMDVMEEDIVSLNNTIALKDDEIADLKGQLDTANQSCEMLNEELSEIRASACELQSQHQKEAEEELARCQQEYQEMVDKLQVEWAEKWKARETEWAEHYTEESEQLAKEAEEEIERVNETVDALRKELRESKVSWEQERNDLEGAISRMATQLMQCSGGDEYDTSGRLITVASLTTKVDTLHNENVQLKSQVEELSKQVTEKEEVVTTLQQYINEQVKSGSSRVRK